MHTQIEVINSYVSFKLVLMSTKLSTYLMYLSRLKMKRNSRHIKLITFSPYIPPDVIHISKMFNA